jgi:hypothetical protein
MMEINAKAPGASFGQRCRTLSIAARAVRERAILDGDDLEGWRLARLMRDALNDGQVNVAEREYRIWLWSRPPTTRTPA